MAGRIPPAWFDQLRSKNDIVQVISGYVPLKKKGRNYWGLCPFHGEKTASFSVDGVHQLYYCFGCKAGGDVIHFVMDIERLDFMDAVKLLAERANMEVPQTEYEPDYALRKSQRERIYQLNVLAARKFHEWLYQPQGAESLEYLKKRGLTDGIIRKFGLGAAPDHYTDMTDYLLSQGYTLSELELAGISVVKPSEAASEGKAAKAERGHDMFRCRAIFPIIDQYNNVLGFGGRALRPGQEPKYLNTADSPVFNKRKGVFAANLLRKERHLDRVILTEGYMDVVSLTQFGVSGVCATLGTALTEEQARLLHRFAPTVYLAYDGDSAGQHAILRGLDIFEAEGIPVRVLDFPDKLDPDEFIRRDGPAAFQALKPISGITYRMNRFRDECNLADEEGRTSYARKCIELLAQVDPLDREVYLRRLSVESGFPKDVLLSQSLTVSPKTQGEALPTSKAPLGSPHARLSKETPSEAVMTQQMLLSLYASGHLPPDLVTEEDFIDADLRSAFSHLQAGETIPNLISSAPDEALRSYLARILMDAAPASGTDEAIRMAHDCLNRLRKLRLSEQITEIKKKLSETLEPEQRSNLLLQIQTLNQKLKLNDKPSFNHKES